MADKSENVGSPRLGPRPFVGGRAVERDAEPRTFSYVPARPFSFRGASRKLEPVTSTGSTSIATPQKSPTPLWTVAIYEPGLEHVTPREPVAARSQTDDIVEASLALAEDVREAQRHAASLTAADTLELIAHRLRRGEILLLPGASVQTEASIVSSVLAALLGGRR
jgi:hypothetical protein